MGYLEFDRVEEADPIDSNQVLEAPEEGFALLVNLFVETEIRHQMDVLDPVAPVDLSMQGARWIGG